MIMPNTLDIGLLPLNINNYEYVESDEFLVDKISYRNITIELTQFDNHLMTFGIYGRDFNSSATKHTITAAFVLAIVSVLVHFY